MCRDGVKISVLNSGVQLTLVPECFCPCFQWFSVFPTADGVLISTCEENTDMYQTYNQNGAKLQNWDGLQFNGYYGYADKKTTYGSYEVYDGFLYTDLSGHIAKISSGGTFEMLS